MMTHDRVTLALDASPNDLTLLQDLIRGRVMFLDEEWERLKLEWEKGDAAETNRLMRSVYVRLERQIALLLDVPFLDNRAAVALIWDDLVAS
jgi:hypothetical protein